MTYLISKTAVYNTKIAKLYDVKKYVNTLIYIFQRL